jgi:hypothetical protein
MCLRGRTGAHVWAHDLRRQVEASSVQFSPVILSNFRPVLTCEAMIAWIRTMSALRGQSCKSDPRRSDPPQA